MRLWLPGACHMMVTDTPDKVLADTKNVLNDRKGDRSWRVLGAEINVPHGILHAIGTGAYEHVSWQTVRKVRARLGLSDPGEIVPAFPCPDCGMIHSARCRGQPVRAVTIVIDKPVRQSAYKALAIPRELHDRLNARRTAAGLTWAELLTTLETG